jgi:general secretion pathway protein I
MNCGKQRGFTLVEVLVALMVVALSLAALMNSVSSAARGSEYLRDKTIAQWIALNRIEEVRLKVQKFGENGDKAEVEFANRKWRYDTRYFDTDNATIRRVVVRVWPSAAKKDAGALAESASFLGSALSPPGTANFSWIDGPQGEGGPGGQAGGADASQTPAKPGSGPRPAPAPGASPSPTQNSVAPNP